MTYEVRIRKKKMAHRFDKFQIARHHAHWNSAVHKKIINFLLVPSTHLIEHYIDCIVSKCGQLLFMIL